MEDQETIPMELQKIIRKKIENIAPAIQLYRNITEQIINYLDNQNSDKIIFNLVTESGKNLENQIHQIILFWGKLPSLPFILEDPFVSFKVRANRILKDDIYKKLSEWVGKITEGSQPKKHNENPLKLSNNDLKLIGSFSILLFSGLLDDYLSRLSLEVDKKTKIITSNSFSEDLKKVRKSVLANKVSILLASLNISEKEFIEKELEKNNIGFCKKNFHEFRKIRNKIAHSGQFIESMKLTNEVENLSRVLKNDFAQQIDSNSMYVMKEKELLKRFINEFSPFVTYLFVIYFQFLPYIIIIDNVALTWINYCNKKSL